PWHVPAGVTDSVSVLNSTDLFPTLSSSASAAVAANYKCADENRVQVLMGHPAPRKKDRNWEYGRNDYAFNYPKGRDRSPNLAIRSGKWKLLMDYQSDRVELYDMVADRYETTDVAGSHPKIVDELRTKLYTWRSYLPELTPERADPARK